MPINSNLPVQPPAALIRQTYRLFQSLPAVFLANWRQFLALMQILCRHYQSQILYLTQQLMIQNSHVLNEAAKGRFGKINQASLIIYVEDYVSLSMKRPCSSLQSLRERKQIYREEILSPHKTIRNQHLQLATSPLFYLQRMIYQHRILQKMQL